MNDMSIKQEDCSEEWEPMGGAKGEGEKGLNMVKVLYTHI
jgi:hypothetical protein